jgi:uncharacterized protein
MSSAHKSNTAESNAAESVNVASPHEIRRPIMLQDWHDLAALHWRYDPSEVQPLLPPGFTVDTFDGSAWVGLIPFHMSRIRLAGLPPFGRLSTFPETNIRTYIVDPGGRRGVWFFSLDVTRLVPALVARLTYRLPYCWAEMTIDSDHVVPGADVAGHLYRDGGGLAGPGVVGGTRRYVSRRRWPRGEATSEVSIRIGTELVGDEITELDHFLSARWALGTTFERHLMWARVSHEPWRLYEADVLRYDETLVTAAGLRPPSGPPIARWSPGVSVRIAVPKRIR